MLTTARLRTKLFVWITTAVVVAFTAIIYIVSSNSIEVVQQGLNQTAMEIAGKFAYQMKAEFEASRTVAVTMKSVFEALKDAGATDRKMMNTILEHILDADKKMLSLCLGYEPNALDGKDDAFKNVKPEHDHTGRYLPYIYRNNGKISIEPLVDYETADWYQIPKKTLKEYLPDPFQYKVSGKETLLVSFLFPLIHKGNFMGIVSTDITLDKLQDMVRGIKPYGSGTVAVIANNGAYAAHVNDEKLNKKVANESIKLAIQNGKQHFNLENGYYTAYYPIHLSQGTPPWSIEIRVREATVLESAVRIRNYVLLVSLLGLFAITLIIFFITRSVTQPILTLATTAEEYGKGNFDTEIKVPETGDELGALAHAFRIMADKIKGLIGDLKLHAVELEKKNRHLRQMDELKDQFLANTSHELRTPINGIVGIMESMLHGATGSLTEDQIHNVSLVTKSARRLSHLINDLVDFTKLKHHELELQEKPVDLKPTVAMIFQLLHPLVMTKTIKLENAIPDETPLIKADENRIQQILLNLIGNAIKFTESGSVTVDAKRENGMVTISVTDTGIGIPQDKIDCIFDSFQQVDGSISREYGGTGLGLTITKKLIELHGSHITVSSTVNEGSVFSFPLSIAKELSARSSTGVQAPALLLSEKRVDLDIRPPDHDDFPIKATKEGRILVVDDEEINIQVLVNILSMQGYAVIRALSGSEALKILEDDPTFDLILLDLMMPRMSGYEVCEQIRLKHPLFELPVLILTAKNQIQDIMLGFKAGANDYVQKPFERQELVARVDTLLMLKKSVDHAMRSLAWLENERQKRVMAETLRDVTKSLNSTLELEEVLHSVLQAVPQFINFKHAVVILNQNEEYVVKSTAGYPEDTLPTGTVINPDEDELLAEILQTKDTAYASNWSVNGSAPAEQGSDHCAAGIPIIYNDTIQGILIVATESKVSDTTWLSTLAGQAGVAIENARLFAKIQQFAITDELTGLHNRRHFFDFVQKELKRFTRYAHPVSVLMCDIDKFKIINDTYGHAAGDRVIARVAQAISASVRDTDVVGRYGGEEFVAMLPHTPLEAASQVAEKIRNAIETLDVSTGDENQLRVTISIGVSEFTKGMKDVSTVFEMADRALYDAKMSGRNRVVVKKIT